MGRIRRLGLILAAVSLGLGGATIGRSAADPGVAEHSLDALSRSCPTPDALAGFLQRQVTFEEDARLFSQPDYWQAPEEFLIRRAGDCEDYALLAQAVLARLGIESFVFSLYGEGDYAHTVCVFVEAGRYSVMNQDRVVRYEARSLEELAACLYPAWTWGAVAERMGHRGRGIRITQRAQKGIPWFL